MGIPRRTEAVIKEITDFGNGVYSVEFSVAKYFTRFKAGQFLHLTLEQLNPSDGYWPESRVISIASEPNADTIRIVYSVKGEYTRKMESALSVGNNYWLKLPYGDFIIERNLESDHPIVLIAGGTGITPYIPFY